MVDVATLVMKVDASDVKDGNAELNKLAKSAGGAEDSVVSLGRAAGVAFAAAATTTAIYTAATLNAADAMNDLNLQTGVALEKLAMYDELARQSGTSTQGVAQGFKFLGKYLTEHGDQLAGLGVTSRDTSEAMRQFADVISRIEDPALRSTLAMEVLGRSGTELLPLLMGGAKAFDEAAISTSAYSKALAAVAPQADKFNDSLEQLKTGVRTSSLGLLEFMLPALNQIISRTVEAQKEFGILFGLIGGVGFTAFKLLGIELDANARRQNEINGLMKEYASIQEQIASRKAIGAETGTLQLQARGLKDRAIALSNAANAEQAAAASKEIASAREKQTADEAAKRLVNREKLEKQAAETAKAAREQEKLDTERWVSEVDALHAKRMKEQENRLGYELDLRKEAVKAEGDAEKARLKTLENILGGELSLRREAADEQRRIAEESAAQWQKFTGTIQQTMGQAFYEGLNGNFKNIGSMFKQMILRMQADALAANLTGALFGKEKGGGILGDIGSKIMGALMPSFAGGGSTGSGSRSGGVDGMGGFPAILHPNETVIDHAQGQSGGASVTVIQNITIDSRSDRMTIIAAMQQAKEMAKGEIMDSLRRGGSFATAVGRA